MKNSIQYLVSTMYKNDESFIEDMNIKDDVVIINQTNYKKMQEIKKASQNIKFISTNERGLSKSRNKAIDNSTADICVISDDDFVYYDDATEKILKAYEKHKDADIITFYFVDANTDHPKHFNNKAGRINYINSLKICSAQITFKRDSINKNNIRFNENFGAGADKYVLGEENVFLYECLKKHLKIYKEPIYILEIKSRENGSTWFEKFDEKYFASKGVAYYEMTPLFYWILIFQYAIRRRKIYKESGITTKKAIQYMLNATKEYKKQGD